MPSICFQFIVQLSGYDMILKGAIKHSTVLEINKILSR